MRPRYGVNEFEQTVHKRWGKRTIDTSRREQPSALRFSLCLHLSKVVKSFSVGRSQLYIHKGARIPLCHVFVCIGEQDVLGDICVHVCLCVKGNKMYWGEYMFTCVFVCKREQGGSCSSSMFPTQWTITTFPLGYKRRKYPFWDPLPKLKANHECHS